MFVRLLAENNSGWSLWKCYKWNTVKFISNILNSKYVAWILIVLNTASSLTLSPGATAFLEKLMLESLHINQAAVTVHSNLAAGTDRKLHWIQINRHVNSKLLNLIQPISSQIHSLQFCCCVLPTGNGLESLILRSLSGMLIFQTYLSGS